MDAGKRYETLELEMENIIISDQTSSIELQVSYGSPCSPSLMGWEKAQMNEFICSELHYKTVVLNLREPASL